jgi:hypothetical protein
VIVALLLALALGCAHAPAPPEIPTVDLGERFTLRPGESAAVAGTPAKVTFERIFSDNRCAVDVVCIVAGEARAWFRLDAEPGRSDTFTLDTDRNGTALVGGYRVSLLSVSPAPRSTVRIDPRNYVVELTVSSPPS